MRISAVSGASFRVNIARNTQANQASPMMLKKPDTRMETPFYGAYFSDISFTRKLSEHRSWGATIDPETKDVSFKILTFKDAKSVDVKVFEADDTKKFQVYPLKNMGDGIFQTENPVSSKDAKPGDKYSFVITKKDGTQEEVKDPYAARQGNKTSEDFLNYSIIYDHSAYEWKNEAAWKLSDKRITRNPKAGNRGIKEASIYEMQIDTLTKEGTYEAAKKKLSDIKKAGFNTVEMMPNENTFDFNWGYDGVDKFAPQEHRGGPDKLKELIDYAHGMELNVIMDYVPNHLGPDGAQLKRTGPYIKGKNVFGSSFNFEGPDSKYVRDYIVNAGINWIDNYKVDGLRLDMTRFIESDYTMKKIAAEINYHFPDAFLIAEDSRKEINSNEYDFWTDYNELHDKRVVKPLLENEHCIGKSEDAHCDYIDSIDAAVSNIPQKGVSKKMISNLGYDGEWDFSYHHSLDKSVYSGSNMDELANAIYHSQLAVKYITSHDETGNMDGTRPVVKYLVPKLNLNSSVVLSKEDKKRIKDFVKLKEKDNVSYDEAKRTVTCQKAQNVGESLTIMLLEGKLDEYKHKSYDEFYDDVLSGLGIKKNANITYKKLLSSFRKSAAQVRAAMALTYAIPGPKMVFQGDENMDVTPFRFFRRFESIENETYLKTEKGYEPGRAALEASILGNIEYSGSARETMTRYSRLIGDLNKLNRENPALTKGWLALNEDGTRDVVVHNNVIGIHTKDEASGSEFFVVSNFKNESYPTVSNGCYNIHFPEGKWVEVLNTDSARYGGSGKFSNADEAIEGFGIDDVEENKIPIKLREHSTVYFKRIA